MNVYKIWKQYKQSKLEAIRLSEYRTVQSLPYEKQWSDARPQYMSIVFKVNGFGHRKVETVGDIYPAKIENEPYWHKVIVPWVNHIDNPSEPKADKKKNNVVKLELVKK